MDQNNFEYGHYLRSVNENTGRLLQYYFRHLHFVSFHRSATFVVR